MKYAKWLPFGLLESLVEREIRNFLCWKPFCQWFHFEDLHISVKEPGLDDRRHIVTEPEDRAICLLKKIDLSLLRISGRDEERLFTF